MIDLNFIFDGVQSTRYGLNIIRIEPSLVPVSWSGGKEVITGKIKGKKYVHHYSTESEVIQFSVLFSLLDEKMTPEKKGEIARWLFKDDFREFQTTDDLTKFYYVIATNQIDFMTTDSELGYFQIDFLTNASHAWSRTTRRTFDLSENETSTVINITNYSNVDDYIYPELEFQLVGNQTSLTLKNLSDGGREFKFTDLTENEKIYVDNEMEQIITDNLQFPFRLGNFNKKWLRLGYGCNQIEVIGKCYLKFRYKFPLYR